MSHLKIIFMVGVFSAIAAGAYAETSTCSVSRQMSDKDGKSIYTVNQRARSLYMISRDLYGDAVNWKHIARWNNIQEPYKLTLGQELTIKIPARLSETEANQVLIQAWTQLDDKGTVAQLQACVPAQSLAAAATVAEVQRTTTPALTSAPLKVPEYQEVELAKPTVEVKKPSPSKEIATSPTEAAKPTPAKKWFWTTSLLGSVFSIENKDESLGDENKLYTKTNYGAELALRWQASQRFATILSAAVEQVEFEPADGAEIEKSQQNFQSYSLKMDLQLANSVATYLGYRLGQRPIYRATLAGVSVDSLYIPEILLGARLRLLGTEKSNLWIVAEGVHSNSASDQNNEIKEGSGYLAGFQFERKFGETRVFNFSPIYKILNADMTSSQNKIEAFYLNLGITW